MKNSLISKGGLLALLLHFVFFSANAQFFSIIPSTAAVPTPGGAVVFGATNTGISATEFGGIPAIASVSDGVVSQINVIHGGNNLTEPIGAGFGFGITDPDVVVIPLAGPSLVVIYFVVYEEAGQILAQDWTYNPAGGGSLTPGIIVPISGGGATNPNIDAVNECGVGIVYERGGEIFGRFGSLGPLCRTASYPSNLNAEVMFSACTPGGNDEPDISLFHDGVNTMANVVYTHTSPYKSLVIQRQPIGDFINAFPVNCAENQILMTLPAGSVLQTPRIASAGAFGGHHPQDCQIVFEHLDGYMLANKSIRGFNHRAITHGLNNYNPTNHTLLPSPIDLCINRRPVVAFTNCDNYMVEWEYAGTCLGGVSPTTQNILTKRLDMAGAEISSDYVLSNFDLTTSANLPSVCGRYVLNPANGIESMHVNPSFMQMLIKSTECNNPNVAKQAADADALPGASSTDDSNFKAYPNPFESSLNFEFEIEGNVDSYLLEILDIHGRLVDSFDHSDLNLGLNQLIWDAPEQVAGTYFIRLSSPQGVSMHKVIMISSGF